MQICRWLPDREIIFGGDSSFAVHTLAAALPGTATPFTFSDAIGAVRMTSWDQDIYRQYPPDPDIPKTQQSRLKRMTQALCFAA